VPVHQGIRKEAVQSSAPTTFRQKRLDGVGGTLRRRRFAILLMLCLGFLGWRREQLQQIGDSKQFEDARGHAGEFKDAETLPHGGGLQTDERAEPRAIKIAHIPQVDDRTSVSSKKRVHDVFDLLGRVAHQAAVAPDRGDLVSVLVFLVGPLNVTGESCRRGHGSCFLS